MNFGAKCYFNVSINLLIISFVMYAKEKNDVISLNLFFLSYHITFDVDSAYDNPSVNEKNVPALNENIRMSTTDNTTFHPSHNQSDTVNKTDPIHDYQSYANSSGGSGNKNLRLLLPETDRPIRKVSALAALCPTNVNPTPSKQVMTSLSPSTISINLSGMIQHDNLKTISKIIFGLIFCYI